MMSEEIPYSVDKVVSITSESTVIAGEKSFPTTEPATKLYSPFIPNVPKYTPSARGRPRKRGRSRISWRVLRARNSGQLSASTPQDPFKYSPYHFDSSLQDDRFLNDSNPLSSQGYFARGTTVPVAEVPSTSLKIRVAAAAAEKSEQDQRGKEGSKEGIEGIQKPDIVEEEGGEEKNKLLEVMSLQFNSSGVSRGDTFHIPRRGRRAGRPPKRKIDPGFMLERPQSSDEGFVGSIVSPITQSLKRLRKDQMDESPSPTLSRTRRKMYELKSGSEKDSGDDSNSFIDADQDDGNTDSLRRRKPGRLRKNCGSVRGRTDFPLQEESSNLDETLSGLTRGIRGIRRGRGRPRGRVGSPALGVDSPQSESSGETFLGRQRERGRNSAYDDYILDDATSRVRFRTKPENKSPQLGTVKEGLIRRGRSRGSSTTRSLHETTITSEVEDNLEENVEKKIEEKKDELSIPDISDLTAAALGKIKKKKKHFKGLKYSFGKKKKKPRMKSQLQGVIDNSQETESVASEDVDADSLDSSSQDMSHRLLLLPGELDPYDPSAEFDDSHSDKSIPVSLEQQRKAYRNKVKINICVEEEEDEEEEDDDDEEEEEDDDNEDGDSQEEEEENQDGDSQEEEEENQDGGNQEEEETQDDNVLTYSQPEVHDEEDGGMDEDGGDWPLYSQEREGENEEYEDDEAVVEEGNEEETVEYEEEIGEDEETEENVGEEEEVAQEGGTEEVQEEMEGENEEYITNDNYEIEEDGNQDEENEQMYEGVHEVYEQDEQEYEEQPEDGGNDASFEEEEEEEQDHEYEERSEDHENSYIEEQEQEYEEHEGQEVQEQELGYEEHEGQEVQELGYEEHEGQEVQELGYEEHEGQEVQELDYEEHDQEHVEAEQEYEEHEGQEVQEQDYEEHVEAEQEYEEHEEQDQRQEIEEEKMEAQEELEHIEQVVEDQEAEQEDGEPIYEVQEIEQCYEDDEDNVNELEVENVNEHDLGADVDDGNEDGIESLNHCEDNTETDSRNEDQNYCSHSEDTAVVTEEQNNELNDPERESEEVYPEEEAEQMDMSDQYSDAASEQEEETDQNQEMQPHIKSEMACNEDSEHYVHGNIFSEQNLIETSAEDKKQGLKRPLEEDDKDKDGVRKSKRLNRIGGSHPLAIGAPKMNGEEEKYAGIDNQNVTDDNLTNVLCKCRVKKNPRAINLPGDIYCQAVDSYDGRMIGCCNIVLNDRYLRVSGKIPFMLLCSIHRHRLRRHNCCPGCGLFCTQGLFSECRYDKLGSRHYYHKLCGLLINGLSLCPHCGTDHPSLEVHLELKLSRKPIFYLKQHQEAKGFIISARMSQSKMTKPEEPPPPTDIPDRDAPILEINSKLISASKLPLPMDKDQLNNAIRAIKSGKYINIKPAPKGIYWSCKSGDLEKLLYVLVKGVSPNARVREYGNQMGLHVSANHGCLAAVHVLVSAGASLDLFESQLQTPLMLAISRNYNDIVHYLIQAGATLTARNPEGMTCLHLAAKSGNYEACRHILDSGRLTRHAINMQDDGGWTPLVWASENRCINVVKILLDRGANPQICDVEQNTALHWAAFSGSTHICSMVIDHGCSLRSMNAIGDTPLHIAARQNHVEAVVLLLARGSSIDIKNAKGQSPIDCAFPDSDVLLQLTLNKELRSVTADKHFLHEIILSSDIAMGKETVPIPCVNGVDRESLPKDYIYLAENCEALNVNIDRTITSLKWCECEDGCNSDNCICGQLSFQCWYDPDGRLLAEFNYADPPMIFECNRACSCSKLSCHNRVVQHGMTSHLQLFRTEGKGWGVRAMREIPKGSYVCEYVGEIITDLEADQREDDSYLFDLDNRDSETFCIDARQYGNVARFINHLCQPNLTPVKLFVDHQDLIFPRIAFFANRDIEADEELGFDYGEKFWIIKYKQFTCMCDSLKCKYSVDTIQATLDNYNKRIQDANQQNEKVVNNTLPI